MLLYTLGMVAYMIYKGYNYQTYLYIYKLHLIPVLSTCIANLEPQCFGKRLHIEVHR